MKILYSIPNPQSVYAARFIYHGLRNAFLDLNHEFRALSSDDDLKAVLRTYRPDIFIYSLNSYHLKFLQLELLDQYRREGLVVFCQVRAWQPLPSVDASGLATGGLKNHRKHRELIANGLAGDVLWHCFEQDEPLMDGFVEGTGHTFETIHLAADRTLYFPEYEERSVCDLAYVGSFLPGKRRFIRQNVLPLGTRYDLRIHGSDWSFGDRLLGHVQRLGQYLDIGPLKGIRELPVSLEQERKLYSSARICLNVHEEHVRRTGSEINERVFKILACAGFQLCDNVRLVRHFFTDAELVIADSGSDWRDKVDHYVRHPDERAAIAENGRRSVLAKHTYHHRAEQILGIARRFREAAHA
jgi:spore maturation protein CgeB